MKRVMIVSYDLKDPGKNYELLLERIKQYGAWARLGGSAYLIFAEGEPVGVRNYLVQVLDQNDQLYVGLAPAPSAWQLPDDVGRWILERQKSGW